LFADGRHPGRHFGPHIWAQHDRAGHSPDTVRLSLSAKISQLWNNIFLSQQISINISISQKYSQPNRKVKTSHGMA
jgi:hypothetical protein